VSSCGGSSHKKTAIPVDGDAGAAGEASTPPDDNGGAGGAQSPAPVGGEGGTLDPIGTGGAGGEGGEGPIATPGIHVLFTVGKGAVGIAGSALAGEKNAQSMIFGSSSENPDPVSGTNQVVVTAAQLGLATTDTIDAFSALQPEPGSPVYLFSVDQVYGEQGLPPTRLNRSSVEDGAPGDVYLSDGSISRRYYNGEGSDVSGYNALVADEQSLGLKESENEQLTTPTGDDLTGIQVLATGLVPGEIYFSVSRDSVGLADTAVATTPLADRGCTVFRSGLDGTNSVALTCAQLGLATGADLRGLTVFGTDAAEKVWFTVDPTSVGLADTAIAGPNPANNVYTTAGDGSNSLQATGSQLGLYNYDNIDAISVIDRAGPVYDTADECQLADPHSVTGANIESFQSAHALGSSLILLKGIGPQVDPELPAPDVIAAYDIKTCAYLGRAVLAPGSLPDPQWTPVPLAGWTAAKPLEKLEYWAYSTSQGETSTLFVNQFDATGTLVSSYGFADEVNVLNGGLTGFSLSYDSSNDGFVGVLAPKQGVFYQRVVFPRPKGGKANAIINPLLTALPHPCAYAPELSGIGPDGTSYFGQVNFEEGGTFYRVCALSPTGEFADLAFASRVDTNYRDLAVIVPGDAVYVLDASSAFTLYRRALR
jgi:hypothetical protein